MALYLGSAGDDANPGTEEMSGIPAAGSSAMPGLALA
jgi:hypothetical protein